ncbi:unnamed protein product, partial [Anisakis simplex]|uniref:C-type lectin domain-containing protein n=1 Tax=Anisakis simplex TaxID=6269 RepID=A0A0M3JKL6_ANISI
NRCPDGGFTSPTNRTKCFKFNVAKENFFEALATCHGAEDEPQAYLASISNVIEDNALRAFALGFGNEQFVWIGLKDFYENGEWTWDHDTNTFRRWSPGMRDRFMKAE